MPDDTRLPATAAAVPAVYHSPGDILADSGLFGHFQRVAKMFSESTLVPEHMRNLPNAFIALNIARRMGEDPLTVMQNVYIVSGRPGWYTQYMIGRANRSGIFKGRISWRTETRPKPVKGVRKIKVGWENKRPVYKDEPCELADLTVTAFAVLADTGEEVTAPVDTKMVFAENWASNEKYLSMQEHMMKWRSASMLIRLYAPEVMGGLPMESEIEEVPAAAPVDITPPRPTRTATPKTIRQAATTAEVATEVADEIDAVEQASQEAAAEPEPYELVEVPSGEVLTYDQAADFVDAIRSWGNSPDREAFRESNLGAVQQLIDREEKALASEVAGMFGIGHVSDDMPAFLDRSRKAGGKDLF